ncbi:P-loop containing nucleoside triphosphate hydrolase protein [Lipomyces japonicus]|uniref:P-loop containing nucleoside triphosphate hydrolase protein n=1 Tax=Lipomyces japonicus TaxID=56871 RepID=UPI0034CEA515
MADDGLLLNLSIPTGFPVPFQEINLTKGRWTDKLKAKRAIQRSSKRQLKSAQKGSEQKLDSKPPRRNNKGTGSNGIVFENSRRLIASKPVLDDLTFKQGNEETKSSDVHNVRPNRDHQNHTEKQFISSLFSSNPVFETQIDKQENKNIYDPSNAPLNETSFTGLGITPVLAKHVQEKLGFEHPTAIQKKSIPPLVLSHGQDLFIQAQTGSGKTLSYVLPIVHKLMSSKEKLTRESGLFAIIIVPTRELANQIYNVLESIVQCCHYIVPGIVIGGEKKKSEKARLRKGVNILVSTPGRLADHFDNTEVLDLSAVRWVVLDEGDRLMELGFEETITKILTKIKEGSRIHLNKIAGLPDSRSTVLCSATMKEEVENLGNQSLSDAVYINADNESQQVNTKGSDADNFSAPDQLHQEYLLVPMKLRMISLIGSLVDIIRTNSIAKIIVFLSCSDSVNFYFALLTRIVEESIDIEDSNGNAEKTSLPSYVLKEYLNNGLPVVHKLHGSLAQLLRKSTLTAFTQSTKSASILLCTDVASRGLDLPSISHVIEFDPPFAIEDHLHRVGRTARAGNKGWATLFLLPGKEEKYITDVVAPYHKSPPIRREYSSILINAFGGKSNWQDIATNAQLDIERWILQSDMSLTLAKTAYTSHVRAYTTHLSSERQYFSVRDLHLGHLAKAFGLRETPAALAKANGNGERTGEGKRKGANGPDYAKKKMLKIANVHANVGADEFNLG